MFKALMNDESANTSLSIGIDSILTAAINMDIEVTPENILDIAKSAIQDTGSPPFDVVLAMIIAHKDVASNDKLKQFIIESWKLLR